MSYVSQTLHVGASSENAVIRGAVKQLLPLVASYASSRFEWHAIVPAGGLIKDNTHPVPSFGYTIVFQHANPLHGASPSAGRDFASIALVNALHGRGWIFRLRVV